VKALERAIGLLAPRRELIDGLVERLIEEETIDGESFRHQVEAWEADRQPSVISAGQSS
jgi:cell division protease FtsH